MKSTFIREIQRKHNGIKPTLTKGIGMLVLMMGMTPTFAAESHSALTRTNTQNTQQSITSAKKYQIQGTVLDAAKLEIPMVSVVEVGTTNGTVTDLDGKFTLNVSSDKAKLKFSFIGYKTMEVDAKTGAPMKVIMQENNQELNEVVVTGYSGTQLRSKTTNSISKVKKEALSVGLFSNPAQALSGAVAGLKVTQTSGNPGSTPSVVLRGGTNLDGSGSPLIIVDGQIRSSMSDINPGDIESMDVMKDAGATAIYGARANNGVILITTKTGKAGHAEINVVAKLGLNYLNNPYDFCNSEQYITNMRNAYKNSANVFVNKNGVPTGYVSTASLSGATPYGTGNIYFDDKGKPVTGTASSIWSTQFKTPQNEFLLSQGWKSMIDPITGKEIIFVDTDIPSYNINSPAVTQDYNINMSGGNEKGSYYAGVGYNHSDGLPINSFYERYSFILNGDYKIKDWLTSYSSFNFTRANWEAMPASQTSEGNYFGRILSLPPTIRFKDEQGNMLMGNNYSDGNQQFQPDKFLRDNQSDKFTMNQSFKIDFLKNLYLKVNANWYYSEGLYESFNRDYISNPGVITKSRNSSASYDRTFNQTYNAVLNFDHKINQDHSLSVLLGTEYYDSYSRGFSASGSDAPTDYFPDLGLTSPDKNKRAIDSYHGRERILSFFGRANYDFKGKYLLSGVVRQDGYSKLLGDNRWGTFPGISAGWIFGREEFMQNFNEILSFGKLRASYGLNGNVSGIGQYQLQGAYGSAIYDGNSGFLLSTIPNPTLKWERSKTFEIGLDLSFIENRITSNFTFYNRLTDDKYATMVLPGSSGITGYTSNNGSFRNRGLEIELGAKIIQTKDFNWNINANIAYNKNTIVSLPDNGLGKNRQNAYEVYTGRKLADGTYEKKWVGGYQEGQEPGVLYAYKALGIYKSYDEIPKDLIDIVSSKNLYGPGAWDKLTASQQGSGEQGAKALPIQPGDVKWLDVNGDNVIDQYDKVKIGNTTPRWIGGFNSTFSWKNLSLYARFDYALDFVVYDNTTPWFMGVMQGTFNMTNDIQNTWSESNPNGTLPRFMWADQVGKNNYRTSSMFAYKGNYLALRELQLTYSVPKAWVNKAKIEKLDLSVTGQNLGYLTAAKKIATPEAGVNSGSGYALPRTLLFGVNLTF